MDTYKNKAAMYLRKSRSDDPAESIDETLAKHQQILNEYAVKNNITVTKIFKEVVSGDGLFTRPQMLAMLNDIENGMYTAVLCVDIDRLGRSSTKDSGIILETFQDNNCVIITPDKIYDLNNDIDQMTVEMKTFLARQELKMIRKRMQRGQVLTLKSGGHTGEPPYGYKRVWLDKTPSLVPTDDAKTVKMIYDWYVNDGYGSYTIANKLNNLGLIAPDGGQFTRSSVRAILSNPTYAGRIVWGRQKILRRRKPGDKYKRIYQPEENWINVDGLHEAIVPLEQWQRAQQIRSTRSHPPTFKGILQNPYAGLIYCSNCGTAIQRQYSNKKYQERLLCPTTGCCGSIKMQLFEERLLLKLNSALSDLKLQGAKKDDNATQNIVRQIIAAKKQINTITNQRDKLHDFLEQGIYDIDTFMHRQDILIQKLNAAERELNELQSNLRDLGNRVDPEEIVPTMENLLHNWDNLIPADKNSILKQLIKRIDYKRVFNARHNQDFEINITWRF